VNTLDITTDNGSKSVSMMMKIKGQRRTSEKKQKYAGVGHVK
jgi:hypothetical protein